MFEILCTLFEMMYASDNTDFTGLVAAIELAPEQGKPGERGYKTFIHAYENGVLVRWTGDILAISPPLIIEPDHIDQLVSALREGILFYRRVG
ncbi:hypothetical protein [Endozoicomonas sp. SESOKO1]|uniref:hypothetical protein n=1 Tax=Endozoicomonas sp. SESOKO1 TaxID=2828742 RepID=UPI0021492B0C|nr:hypothetical protein [Endozoicomonas sp. SESOKO1]